MHKINSISESWDQPIPSPIYIYHNLGLGDHIICNGLVRNFYKKLNGATLFCYKHNVANVSRMFSDLSFLNIIAIKPEEEPLIKDFLTHNNLLEDTINATDNFIGSKIENPMILKSPTKTFDEVFYERVGLNFSVRFDDFFIRRDFNKESRLLKNVLKKGASYNFVHGDESRGFLINESLIKNDFNIIYSDSSIPIFDYISVINKASEVHVMQSSFKDLINSFDLSGPKFFLHSYVRSYDSSYDSKGKNKFIKL